MTGQKPFQCNWENIKEKVRDARSDQIIELAIVEKGSWPEKENMSPNCPIFPALSLHQGKVPCQGHCGRDNWTHCTTRAFNPVITPNLGLRMSTQAHKPEAERSISPGRLASFVGLGLCN
ncbi:conserved hypothetical protein [Ricinus communis]|uniref:Uncharacterized protein n=1 Tax=Ricinus communis TaxID=3988 RepID=B9RF74_RICCO|nr:conserved hypothetical protein [Ricinus communis]